MPHDLAASADHAFAGLIAGAAADDAISAPRARFDVECIGPDGEVKWTDSCLNVVTTAGKQHALDVVFGATAKASWFIVLAGSGTKANADTLASHAGWTEFTAYSGSRPAITFGSATVVSTTGAQVTNTGGTPVDFTITGGGGTVAGAGICAAATLNTATLYNVGDFASARTVAANDVLRVTITLSLAA